RVLPPFPPWLRRPRAPLSRDDPVGERGAERLRRGPPHQLDLPGPRLAPRRRPLRHPQYPLDGLLRDGLAGEATAAVAVVEDGLERGGGVGHGNSGSLEGVSARVSHAGALASEPGRRLRYARGMAVRVDAWTWSVRLFRSRTKAAAACRGGHVKINGETAQPSKTVVPGDRVQVTGAPGRTRILEVVETVSKRVGAPVAATCYID